ncbi:MAG: hypothetical protein QM750_20600 [Rubrivivax sp.]
MVLLMAACAASKPRASPDNVRGADFVPPPAGSLIVLLPPPQTPELSAGENFMSAQLSSQLRAAGYRVGLLDRANYDEIWAQEVVAAGGLFDPATGVAKPLAYGTALSRLARRVCEEAKCALLVQQRLVPRSAKLDGRIAEWDGQRRAIPLKNDRGSDYSFKGSTRAISVELIALTAEGKLGFRSYGGLALPFQTNVEESRAELRTHLFPDDQETAEAVQLALEPLIAAP